MQNAKPFFASVSTMMAIMLVGKVMGVLRDRMLGVYYGTYSPEGIAFMQASLLPRQFLDIMFASVFSASFIPVFNRYLETQGKQAAFELAARFVRVVVVLTAVFVVLGILFAPQLYHLLLGGTQAAPETRALGIVLLRLLFPLMILSGLAFSLTGVLQSLGQFNIPAAMSVASNGIILLYYFFFIDYLGVYGLAAAFLLGWGAQVLIQLPFLVRQGFFKRRKDKPAPIVPFWKDDGLRQIAQLALPVMVASWVGPVNILVNGRAAADLYGGQHGYVAINFAHTLYTVVTGLFVLSLANVLFPKLSKLAALEDWDGFFAFLRSSLRSLFFLLLPMTFGLMAVARPLVRLVFQDGRFQEVSVGITATALWFFALGIVGFGLQIILSRACYALKYGRGPLVTGVLAMGVNLVLSFALAPTLEIGGPALASAIAINLAAGLLFVLLRRQAVGALWNRTMSFDILKMLCLSLAMFAGVGYLLAGLERLFVEDTLWVRLLTVGVPAALGAAFYMVGCWLLRVEEARNLVRWAVKR